MTFTKLTEIERVAQAKSMRGSVEMTNQCPYHPAHREDPLHPPRAYAEYRKNQPVVQARLWNGNNVWLVTRYNDVREVLRDHETFSQQPLAAGYPSVSPGRNSTLTEETPTFPRMDPPEQTRLRRTLTADFTMKRATAMRPRIESIVDGLLDQMEQKGPPADLKKDFALPLPTTVISDFLGLPPEDHRFVNSTTDILFDNTVSGEEARTAQLKLLEYLKGRFHKESGQSEPTNLVAKLAENYVEPGHVSLDEAAQMLQIILVAGHETTANMLALGTLTLLQYPDQLALLRENRSLMGSAINEMLRFLTINHNTGTRICVKDTILGGQRIKPGEGVHALMPSANRDSSIFNEADQFDITRNPVEHTAFGYGTHRCVGANLATTELEIALNKLLDRFPRLSLAVPFKELDFKHDSLVFGVRSVPVSWH